MNTQQTLSERLCCAGLAPLHGGEKPMPMAPIVELPGGELCIPQHYLQYTQTVETVSAILNDIDAVDHFLLFCGDDDGGLYLQVGTIGPDNYKPSAELRIVYGRKWRIERYTPTSEVIQTAFLALKKAAEHEVRELLTVMDVASGRRATPFSTHGDLPLMARFPELVVDVSADVEEPEANWLQGVRFDGREMHAMAWTVRSHGRVLVDVLFDAPMINGARSTMGELNLTVVLDEASKVALLHGLMNALIVQSDRRIDEQFRYRGFARFSQALSPERIGSLSVATRSHGLATAQFEADRAKINREIDRERVPSFGSGALANKNQLALQKAAPLGGLMPMTLTRKRVSAHRLHALAEDFINS